MKGKLGALVLLVLLVGALGCGGRTPLATGERATPAACSGVSVTPVVVTTVGEVGKFPRVTAMTVVGASIYYTVNDSSNNPVAMYRVPVTGGAPTKLVDGQGGCDTKSPIGYGLLENDGRRIYTTDEESIGCSGYSRHVTVYDDATDQLTRLENPPGSAVDPIVTWPKALPGGGVAWVVRSHGVEPGSLVVWDGTGDPRIVTPLGAIGVGLAIVGGDAFVTRILAGQMFLDRIALAKGAITSTETFGGTTFRLLGANDQALYYSLDGKVVTRRVVATSATSTVDAEVSDVMFVGDEALFFARSPGPPDYDARVMRSPAAGGTATELYRDAGRKPVQAITADACHVYVALGPDFNHQAAAAIVALKR